jgi:hypothetical protein
MKKITQTDIINYFIKKYKYKSYLEIGVKNPKTGNFNNIKIKNKIGIEPNPVITQDNILICTSDFFFIKNKLTFDLIFIDGLNIEMQVDKDILNSLNSLNDGGIIILNGCNPPSEKHQKERINVDGYGTVWRSFAKLRMTREDLSMYVVDTNFGVGIIMKGTQELFPINKLNYDLLEKDRVKLLNLISVNTFNKIFKD